MANTDIINLISKKVCIEMIHNFDDIDRDQFGIFCEYYDLPFIPMNSDLAHQKWGQDRLIKFIKEMRSIQRVPFALLRSDNIK